MAIHTIDELLRDAAAKHPDATLLSYFTGSSKSEKYSASDLNLMSQRSALWYSRVLPKIRKTSDDAPIVVAILGPTNVEYISTYLALQRLGITVLFLSTRLAAPAYHHLFQKTKSNVVITQPAFMTVMGQTNELMNGNLAIIPMLDHAYITNPNVDSSPLPCNLDPAKEYNRLGWIIHSSGSTGLPKPVGHFQRTALSVLDGLKFSFNLMVTVPIFHTFGLHGFLKAIHTAKTCTILSSDLPITGENLMQCVIADRPEFMFTVPYLMKLMAETEGAIPELAKLNRIFFSGASCPQALGDKLVAGGATISSCMGSTEIGQVMTSSNGKEGWNWYVAIPPAEPHLAWEEEDGGLFQMIVKKNWRALVAENRFDGSYATGDLFQKHPTKPGHFKYIGRRDDTIVMFNGEKANPIPLENAMRKNKLVDEAIAFGQGKATLGLIVIPSEETRGMNTTQVIDAIMDSVEEGNALVPAYARIYRDAIIVKPIGTWFSKTDKGTAIRAAFINTFTPDIEAYYEKLELDQSSSGRTLPEAEIRQLIRDTVLHSLQLKDTSLLQDDTDFFSLGLDSLMAINIRLKLAQEINTNGQVLSSNVVFEKPNIDALTAHLVSLSTGAVVEQKESVEEVMTKLIEKYSNFQTHKPNGITVEGEYVVLTGATGSIGSHILSTLLQRPEVKVVYCLVRASSLENASERVNGALSKAHLLESLSTEQRDKILALPSDLSDEYLGLPARTYRSVLSRATAVIHNAWGVNFNMDVTSFEGQHIRGSSNLINFCLASPQNIIPSFNFISSVSTAMGRPEKTVPEVLPEFSHAMPMGYAHSKMVVEYLCDAAAKKTGMTARILRVGQVVGDTKHGRWNATEAIPLTVQAAVTVGALPVLATDENVSWLPVDATAATVVDLSLQEKKESRVFNVCHPGLLKWNEDFLPALKKSGLEFEAVDGAEWVKRLEKEQNPAKNPPIKLLDFFRMRFGGKMTAEPYFETKASCENSKTLQGVQNVNQELVAKFVKYWKEECW
ncbi:hypothetical protein BZA77DRAFT_371224 [Pyronema omphalodes]|nr:hypothetical protein BZA77DRAFT_371224 [Pyronema omphalodes]